MSFDGSNGDGLSLPRLLGFQNGAGPNPGSDPISLALADIAQRARLPKVGGLFGGDYARFMAGRAAPSPSSLGETAPGTHRPELGIAWGLTDHAPAAASPDFLRPTMDGAPNLFPAIWAGDRPSFDDLVTRPTDPTAQFISLAQGDASSGTSAPARSDVTSGMPEAPRPLQEDERTRQLDALVKYLPQLNVEGSRPDVYRDSRGFLTVGVGHKVTPADHLELGDKPGDARIGDFLRSDAAAALDAARNQAADAGITDPNFIVPLASVNFQLGTGWRDKFVKTWPLIVKGDYAAAAKEAANSDWNEQTPKRVRQFQEALRRLPPKPTAPR